MPPVRKRAYDPEPPVRVPPYSVEAESAILGAVLLDAPRTFEYLSGRHVEPAWFWVPANRLVFEKALEMHNEGKPVDAVTLAEALEKAGTLEKAGGLPAIEKLTMGNLVLAHTEYYADILREKFLRRRIIETAESAASRCYGTDEEGEISEILGRAQADMLEISAEDENGAPDWNKSLTSTFDRINALFSNNTGLTGLSTGFKDLDKTIQGLRPAEMVVLAARPSMGKTSLAMNICTAVALGADCTGNPVTGGERQPVAIFSCEMSTDSLVTRMLCSMARVPYYDIVRAKYSSEEEKRRQTKMLSQAASKLMDAPIYVDDTGGLDISDLRARARRLKKRHGIKLVMIDYLQLLNCNAVASQGRQIETSRISGGIKAMAKELDVPVLVLSQLARKAEEHGGEGRPALADLRDSGAIEQDADVVMLLRRPCKYPNSKDHDQLNLAVVDVAKNRNGRTGEVKLTFIDELTQFTDAADEREEDPADY
ncbi:MAG: replicative DNA helicase [Kiritimatiellae bacterium]|nr:replicative DNA helicase [Kiritimatiellia bacterium]MBR1836320.1 replicative DNA helicase [Kiritimatiellia bacterium]